MVLINEIFKMFRSVFSSMSCVVCSLIKTFKGFSLKYKIQGIRRYLFYLLLSTILPSFWELLKACENYWKSVWEIDVEIYRRI